MKVLTCDDCGIAAVDIGSKFVKSMLPNMVAPVREVQNYPVYRKANYLPICLKCGKEIKGE